MRTLPVVFTLGYRNLWRNPRRTLIMVAAVTIGVSAMIIMNAMMRGMVEKMITDGIAALPGHVQIHQPEFRDDPSIANAIPIPDSELAATLTSAGVQHWGSRIRVPAVVTSERDSRGVVLLGIDPARELGLIFVEEDDVQGRFLEGVDDKGIVIGRKLAETLETEIGKRVVVMTQSPDNEIADRGFRVVGLYTASTGAMEEAFAFVGKGTAQSLLGVPDTVTEAFVVGDDQRNVDPIYEKVAPLFDDRVEVLRWTDLDSFLGSMVAMMDGWLLLWIIIVFLALSFGLVNTLVMAVFERVREIGLMLALGMKPRGILMQIVFESLLLLAIGLAAGNLIAWAVVTPLEGGIDLSIVADGMAMMGASSTLYPKLTTNDVIMANVVVLFLGFLASLSPAWRASRYEPVEAITKVD